jgi:hypothetical protein
MSPTLTERSDRKCAGRIDSDEYVKIVEENFHISYESEYTLNIINSLNSL